jgi:hypothetical protein
MCRRCRYRGARRSRRSNTSRIRQVDLAAPRPPLVRAGLAGNRIRADRPLAGCRPAAGTRASLRAHPETRIIAVSGSCSPVTARQIRHAGADGFQEIALDTALAVDAGAWKRELDLAAKAALTALSEGCNPLIHSACGPQDPPNRRARSCDRDRGPLDPGGERPHRNGARPASRRLVAAHGGQARRDRGRRHLGPRRAAPGHRCADGACPSRARRAALHGPLAGWSAARPATRAEGRPGRGRGCLHACQGGRTTRVMRRCRGAQHVIICRRRTPAHAVIGKGWF